MHYRYLLPLLLALLIVTGCEDDEPTVDLESYRQLLVADDNTSWVPTAIYYTPLDSAEVDTLQIIDGDTSDMPVQNNPAVHRFTSDGTLFLSLTDGTPIDTLQYRLEQPGYIFIDYADGESDRYHDILEIEDSHLHVSALNAYDTDVYYDRYEIKYVAQ